MPCHIPIQSYFVCFIVLQAMGTWGQGKFKYIHKMLLPPSSWYNFKDAAAHKNKTKTFLLSSAGRRWTHGGLLIASGIGCLAWVLLHWMGDHLQLVLQAHSLCVNHKPLFFLGSSASLKMAVALLGKFTVTGSFVIIKLYAAELFPTQIRCVHVKYMIV